MTIDRRAKLGELKARRQRLTTKAAQYRKPPARMVAELQRLAGDIGRLQAELRPAETVTLGDNYFDSYIEWLQSQGVGPSGPRNGCGVRR